MPIESLMIGLIVLLICGAAFFYLYMRISFYERKGSMMESVIVDLKVAIDSLMMSGQGGGAPIPISPAPAAFVPVESEPIPDETFYSSILEQAHEGSPDTGVTLDKALESFDSIEVQAIEPDIDNMTKNELLAEAEKKGVRAKKSMSRTEILGLLRRPAPSSNNPVTTGAENGSGSAAALDGSVVDLGQDSSSMD
ncbi:hypothetical protein EBR66_06730 [bacterium]|nr:hypothetical protein [bacterium]